MSILSLVLAAGLSSLQPAPQFVLVCRGSVTSGSDAAHTRRTQPWSGRIDIDLVQGTWRMEPDGKPARMDQASVDGAILTGLKDPRSGTQASVRWVKGDAHFVSMSVPSFSVIRSDCAAEDPRGRPLALLPAR